ncbi:lysophospholipid acyltransferase family protein [Alteraurantiacibacter aquimixticola]|uniref:1-acyl-sn-glycerol-3-phosphate acyltransferase n=1 Tax=Alteraurantiacibacter aquimixticola TaxID=2489173 RepID=A0A4T3EWQ6_9SPHN|nr:lysophospholipid acyltransferase family protein [Alteraurantiacibacter aquimixticola]TIX48878.1 1-acyl-sn-glycerol-3-phosphate acyltransferase [Alteraurantiacibacter aquimixticola]
MIASLVREIIFALTRFLVGGNARWIGCGPDQEQRIYFANHASHLDTIILWACLPPTLRRKTHPVAAADYWGRNAFTRFIALDVLNAVLVERAGSRDPLAPLRDVLDKGESLIIFPEGTRGKEVLPGTFKSGLHHLARDYPQAQLVPVYLANLARAYPKGAVVPAPINCVANFGTPLALAEDEDKGAFLERARKAVAGLSGEMQA